MAKLFITLASLSGILAVVFGAFGAHALKGKLDDQALKVFETAVQYHFYHTFALLVVGVIALNQPQSVLLKSSGWLFVVGVLVFSGSLYLLSLTGVRWLGAITPLGGLALIAGWGCLAAAGWKLLV
jgi:uncharacterized membrane protein YgdD (TMEM256/DUF423 family)